MMRTMMMMMMAVVLMTAMKTKMTMTRKSAR